MKLLALRDLAITHFPRAGRVSTALPPDEYQRTLYGFAALVPPNAPATELLAAYLMQTVMRLLIDWPSEGKLSAYQRQQAEQEAIDTAIELCELTGTAIPWLAHATPSKPAPAPPPPVPELVPVPASTRLPAPPPGIMLSTREAAEYLNMRVQTLHMWSSTDSGLLRPVRLGTSRLGWKSDDVLALMQGK